MQVLCAPCSYKQESFFQSVLGNSLKPLFLLLIDVKESEKLRNFSEIGQNSAKKAIPQ